MKSRSRAAAFVILSQREASKTPSRRETLHVFRFHSECPLRVSIDNSSERCSFSVTWQLASQMAARVPCGLVSSKVSVAFTVLIRILLIRRINRDLKSF